MRMNKFIVFNLRYQFTMALFNDEIQSRIAKFIAVRYFLIIPLSIDIEVGKLICFCLYKPIRYSGSR
jgi:hypothetical protein